MITRQFGRDEHPFRLTVPGWRAVEKTCDAGLGEIASRLAPLVSLLGGGLSRFPGGLLEAMAGGHLGRARLDDVREPILQGLIGGGMSQTIAGAVVAQVFDGGLRDGQSPMLEHAYLAFEILSQAIIGLSDEPLGEPTATSPKPEARRRSRTAKPASSSSTASPG